MRRLLIAASIALTAVSTLACSGERSTPRVGDRTEAVTVKTASGSSTAAERAKRRAQVVADAEAKDRANLEAYEAEVVHIKAAHEKAMVKYTADLQVYRNEEVPA